MGFGTFQQFLTDFPAAKLHETIPNFHNTPDRYRAFLETLERDPMHRAAQVQPEIEFALTRQAEMSTIQSALTAGELPLRVTHNDTKLNNVLLDAQDIFKSIGIYLGHTLCLYEMFYDMTLLYDVLEAAYKTAVQLKNEQPEGCARLMGIHMEGPFFSEKKKGAQNGAYLRLPDFEAFQRLYDVSEGLIRIADVAAELPGAIEFAEKASRLCTVSIAHTDCTYE